MGKLFFGMIGEFGPVTPWNLGFGVIFFRNEALSEKLVGFGDFGKQNREGVDQQLLNHVKSTAIRA
jgi:hypothetical protein